MNREVMSIEEAIKRNMEFMNITKNVYELEKLHGKTVNLMFDIASLNVCDESKMENMYCEIHECYRRNLRRL